MGYAIRMGEKYVKRTSQFGKFHGSIVLTSNPDEKRVWTREADALDKVSAILFRKGAYQRDKNKLLKEGVLDELPMVVEE